MKTETDASYVTKMVLYVAAILSFVGMIFVGLQMKKSNECQQRYAEANYRSAVARSHAADERQEAFDNLWVQLLGSKDKEQSRKLAEAYVASRQREKDLRKQNPIPDPPKEFCR